MNRSRMLQSFLSSQVFSPLELFANNEQGAWYDPSDLSTIFQDDAGTIPVENDGDSVGLILDKSGNNNHAHQSNGASKPTYKQEAEYSWLEFDGIDDYLFSEPTDYQFIDCEISASVRPNNFTNRGVISSLYDPSNLISNIVYLEAPTSSDPMFAFLMRRGQNGDPPRDDYNELRDYVLTGFGDESTNSLRVDGEIKASINDNYGSDNLPIEPITLGCRLPETDRFFDGRIYNLVFRISDNLLNDYSDIESYLAKKSGITL